MKKPSLSILAVLLSVCLLFMLSVQCFAAEVMGNPGMEAAENDLNNGFIEGNPNNPNDGQNDGNNGSGFTSDGTNESGNANGSYNGNANDSVGNGNANETAAAQNDTANTDDAMETGSGFSWVMLLVWLVIIAAVVLLIVALLPKRRNGV